MLKVDQIAIIRHKVINEGMPIRLVARSLKMSRNTVRRYVRDRPEGRRRPPKRRSPKMEQVAPKIERLLEEWSKRTTSKQRITGSRVHEQLVTDGVDVGVTTVRSYLRQKRRAAAEVYIPLVHRPGEEAQVDFFDVTVDVADLRRSVALFQLSLPYSDWDFAWLYEWEDLPSFLDGHVRAFEQMGGVPWRLVYDNLRLAIKEGPGPDGERVLNRHFARMVAHFAFKTSFTRVGEGHDKGAIEVRGKRTRLQRLVPIPKGDTLADINQGLSASLAARAAHRKDIEGRTVQQRLEEEQRRFLPLPAVAFDPRLPAPVTVSRRSLVRLGGGIYSLPSTWGPGRAMAWVGATDVRFELKDAVEIRQRVKSGGKSVRYVDYLPELAKRPQAVVQVAPELMAELGEEWTHLWQLLQDVHDDQHVGRIVGGLLAAVVKHGADTVNAALRQVLMASNAAPVATTTSDVVPTAVTVPEALRSYQIGAAQATDYDHLLLGGAR
jgi:transposase